MSHMHTSPRGLDLQCEIENLRTELKQSGLHVKRLEMQLTEMMSAHEVERNKLKEELSQLSERYERLVSNHLTLSELNNNLEERLISTIETSNAEKSVLSQELEVTRNHLTECENNLATVTSERNQYKEDCSTATALLRANPDQFLHQVSSTTPAPRVSSSFFPTFPPVGLHMFNMDPEATDQMAASTNSSCRLASSSSSAREEKSSGYIADL